MSQPLSNLSPGSLIKLGETVSGVKTAEAFLVAAHDHHAPGRTTLLRKTLWSKATTAYQKSTVYTNAYSGCLLDTWLTGTYITYLDLDLQELLADVSIRAGSGSATISRCVFSLSATEMGIVNAYAYSEGTAIPYFASDYTRCIGRLDTGTAVNWWTRSPRTNNAEMAVSVSAYGGLAWANYKTDYLRARPALTLPSDLKVTDAPDADGCYLPSFSAKVPVRVSGVWRAAEPLVKVSGAWCASRPKMKVSGVWYDAG